MKIFVDENIPMGKEVFSKFGEVTLYPGRSLENSSLKDADALITRSITKVSRNLLEGTSVKFVGTATIGTDHIDIPCLEEKGIGFSSAPGCNSNSVGEYISTALLHLQVTHGVQLEGLTMGIVGCGNVGTNTSGKARALGIKVLHNDPPLQDAGSDKFNFVSLEEIQQKADIITFHVPMVKEGPHPTYELFDSSFSKKLSKPVIIMNTSRGHVLNKDALIQGKDSGSIKHLILDVFPEEPTPDPELINRCDIATPHIAGYSVQGKHNGTYQILKAFCSFFNLPYPEDTIMPQTEEPDIFAKVEESAVVMYEIARKAYPIMEDDERLRNSICFENPGVEFDKLRKTYPRRFEFPCYNVRLRINQSSIKTIIEQLGFNIL